MKNYLLLIIFLMIFSSSWSQKKEKIYHNYSGKDYLIQEGFIDKNKKKTKEWITYYQDFSDSTKTESSQIKSITEFKDGLKNGSYKSFYVNGNIKQIDSYKNGIQYGDSKIYFPNGKVNIETSRKYLKDSLTETIISFYNENEDLLEKKIFTRKSENYTSYYQNGNVHIKGNYIQRLKNGEWIKNFSNGKINEITNYKNGTKNGDYKEFNFKNGELILTGKYLDNKKSGIWTLYYNGKARKTITYKDGIEVDFYEETPIKSN